MPPPDAGGGGGEDQDSTRVVRPPSAKPVGTTRGQGTCHKCAAPLGRGTQKYTRCPGCRVVYHIADCGQRFAAIANQHPNASLEDCPKCNNLCLCSGGRMSCHAGRLRSRRKHNVAAIASVADAFLGRQVNSGGAERPVHVDDFVPGVAAAAAPAKSPDYASPTAVLAAMKRTRMGSGLPWTDIPAYREMGGFCGLNASNVPGFGGFGALAGTSTDFMNAPADVLQLRLQHLYSVLLLQRENAELHHKLKLLETQFAVPVKCKHCNLETKRNMEATDVLNAHQQVFPQHQQIPSASQLTALVDPVLHADALAGLQFSTTEGQQGRMNVERETGRGQSNAQAGAMPIAGGGSGADQPFLAGLQNFQASMIAASAAKLEAIANIYEYKMRQQDTQHGGGTTVPGGSDPMARFLRTIASLSEGVHTPNRETPPNHDGDEPLAGNKHDSPSGEPASERGNSAPPDDSTAGEGAEEGEREADEPPAKRGKTSSIF